MKDIIVTGDELILLCNLFSKNPNTYQNLKNALDREVQTLNNNIYLNKYLSEDKLNIFGDMLIEYFGENGIFKDSLKKQPQETQDMIKNIISKFGK